MFVKSRNTDEFPKSFHLYHHKKKITYSQYLKLNRIFFENKSFDKRCNDLEKEYIMKNW